MLKHNHARLASRLFLSRTPMTTAALTLIDTAHLAHRRKLRFHSLDEALAEADLLVAAEKAGQLQMMNKPVKMKVNNKVILKIHLPRQGVSLLKLDW